MKPVAAFLSKERVILCIYILASLVIGIPHYLRGPRAFNNFIIYRQSLPHLLAHQNLYLNYNAEYYDLFLYNPSFCILFAPFSYLPIAPALWLWLMMCAMVLFYGIKSLPVQQPLKVFIWWFVFLELLNAMNSEQTNPLIAAMGFFTFSFLEKGKNKWAALFPVLAFCIKGYGVLFAVLFLFYPKKKDFILYSVFWLVCLSILPIPAVGPENLWKVYAEWMACLAEDHHVNYGFSIMGLLKLLFDNFTEQDALKVQIAGIMLLAATLLKNLTLSPIRFERKLFILGYLSLWVILFNHVSESQTFVIAVQGVALVYLVTKNQNPVLVISMAILVVVVTMLSPLDVFPSGFHHYQQLFMDNLVEVVPCLLVFMWAQVKILQKEPDTELYYRALA